jgi:tellurite resistance protein TerC
VDIAKDSRRPNVKKDPSGPSPMPAHDPSRAVSGNAPRRPGEWATALGCIAASVAFGAAIWLRRGPEPAQQYLAGYLVELSLSVDNVFVFALVFEHFRVEPKARRGLLFWGILGAIVLRSAFLIAGIGAIHRFAWIIPVFGAFILLTAIRLSMRRGTAPLDLTGNPVMRLVMKSVPPALAAIVALEVADLIFALDSLPAVLAVTHNVKIAIASNLFAILGLRSLFSIVSGAVRHLRFLRAGLAGVLGFVGAKMLAEPWYAVPTGVSLLVIAAILALSICASIFLRRDARR